MNDTTDSDFWMSVRTVNNQYDLDGISLDQRNSRIANLISKYFDDDDMIEDMSNRLGIDPATVSTYYNYDETN